MTLIHLPRSTNADEVARVLELDGACIIDNLATYEQIDRVVEEIAPYVDLTSEGTDEFVGFRTRRTGSLISRSPTGRELVKNPLILGVAGQILERATVYQLHVTQLISIFPGETEQPLHRDETAWDFYPFPTDYNVLCATIWAMTDFTVENGATRVLPGTHILGPDATAAEASLGREIDRAEMERGSVFVYTGKVFHGAGANQSQTVRQGLSISYSVGWIRQEENQYLSTPIDVARTLDDDLLRLMGYQLGGIAIGYVRDFEDPLVTVRDLPKAPYDFAAQVDKAMGTKRASAGVASEFAVSHHRRQQSQGLRQV
jgi:hypothetical protein